MLHERSHVRFNFTCAHCRHQWQGEYEIDDVDDEHGHSTQYYKRNGLPTVSPLTEGGVACPQCGALHHTCASTTIHRAAPGQVSPHAGQPAELLTIEPEGRSTYQ